MKLIEYIKTTISEFSYIKNHIVKKTNERLMANFISKQKYELKESKPTKKSHDIYQKYLNEIK